MAKPLDIDIVKRPHSQDAFTEKQLLELMDCVDDPLYFSRNFIKIQHPVKGVMPFDLYPFQESMIKAFREHRFCVALTARQMGKSVISSTIITHIFFCL